MYRNPQILYSWYIVHLASTNRPVMSRNDVEMMLVKRYALE